MKTLKGPAIFLAQFIGDEAPFNSLENIVAWVSSLGFKGIQMPTGDTRFFDLEKAAESASYCDDLRTQLDKYDLKITEISTHLQGQLVSVHSAYSDLFKGFAPEVLKDKPEEWQGWATKQLIQAASASQNLGIKAHATFSGALAWHLFYPWPQRPAGLIEEVFAEQAKRWLPILDEFDKAEVDICYELHPGEDLHDGATFECFLDAVDQHPRANILYDPSHFVLQQLDYLKFIDLYHERIRAFHVKDAEFNSDGRTGVYGGYQPWLNRAGRFRSLGDGQIDFRSIFSKMAQYDFPGWAVLEWECCIKHPEQGAAEGAKFIEDRIIQVTDRAFDDFASTQSDTEFNRKILGLE